MFPAINDLLECLQIIQPLKINKYKKTLTAVKYQTKKKRSKKVSLWSAKRF